MVATWDDDENSLRADQETVIPLITMSPNLKHLYIRTGPGHGEDSQQTNESWRTFMTSFDEPPPTAQQPVTLSLRTGDLPCEPFLAKWGEFFPLSHVHTMDIMRVVNGPQMISLLSRLEKLERLFICIDNEWGFHFQPSVNYRAIFEPSSMNSLRMFCIRGRHLRTLFGVAESHGQTLESLIIESTPFLQTIILDLHYKSRKRTKSRPLWLHGAGMNRKYRQIREILFRKGFLRVVIATGTLALGINMPCKTVIFSGDSVFLTALNFRQAAGRAGRRGFDIFGNVVFQQIPTAKVQRLISSRLPDLNGHFPITTNLVL